MNSFKIVKIIDLLIEFLLTSILFFVPLFFAFFLKTNNVFELNKIVLFKILVLILIFLTFIKFVLEYKKNQIRVFWQSIKLYENKIVFWVFSTLVISFLISVFFSINIELSVYGSYFRQQGIITFIYLLLFLITILVNVKNYKQLLRMFCAISLSAFFVSIYGIIQAVGLDPYTWIESTQLRSTSTLGQPNNLGSFFIATIPITIFLLIKIKPYLFKFFIFILLVAQFFSLYFSFSISSWLGVIIGAFITICFYFLSQFFLKNKLLNFKKNKKIIWFFLIFLFSCFLIFLSSPSNSRIFKNKLLNLTNPQSGSTAVRLQFWEASKQAIKVKPWFGYGLDTQEDVLLKYYKPNWALFSNVNVRPSRAHNIFLDILLTRGILGLITTLAFIVLVLKLIWQNIKENRNILLNYLILFYFISYLVYLNFNFHHITSLVYFVFYLAVLFLIREKDFSSKTVFNNTVQISAFSGKKIFFCCFICLFTCFFLIFLVNRQVKVLINDSYLYELKVSKEYRNYFFALDLYDFFQNNSIQSNYYEQQFGFILAEWAKRYNGLFYNMGMEKVKIILPKIDKDNFTDMFVRAKLYSILARQDNKYYTLAEDNFEKLIKISPDMPSIYREYANMYLTKEDNNDAIKYYKLALNKLPDIDNQYINKNHKKIVVQEILVSYNGIMLAYENLGDVNKTEQYQKMIDKLNM